MSKVKPSDVRLDNWNRKFNPERIKQMCEEGKPAFLARAREKFDEITRMEVSAKQFLNQYPIPVSLVSSYLCFAREMWKASQRYSGVLLSAEAAVKVAKWTARQLDKAILSEMCYMVFSVPLPAPEA